MTDMTSGPTLAQLQRDLERALPGIDWQVHDRDGRGAIVQGLRDGVLWSAVIHPDEPGVLLTAEDGPREFSNRTGPLSVDEALVEVRDAALTTARRIGALDQLDRAEARAKGLRVELTAKQVEAAELRRELRRIERAERRPAVRRIGTPRKGTGRVATLERRP